MHCVPSERVAESVDPEEGGEPAVAEPPHAAVVHGADDLAVLAHVVAYQSDVIRHLSPEFGIGVWGGKDQRGFGGFEREAYIYIYNSVALVLCVSLPPPYPPISPSPSTRARWTLPLQLFLMEMPLYLSKTRFCSQVCLGPLFLFCPLVLLEIARRAASCDNSAPGQHSPPGSMALGLVRQGKDP